MISESLMLAIRHGLTAAGGYMVTTGIATTDEINIGVGAVVTMIGLGWSWYRKWVRAATA